MTGIINQLDGVQLREKRGGSFKFKIHMTQAMSNTSIEALELSVRAYNSLKRAGYNTIGDLAEAIASGSDLKNIRNCGKTSVRDIMEHLFLYQYNSLPINKQEEYLKEVVLMNRRKISENE